MKELRISASQIESFLLCSRKWWFQSIQRMPEVAKGSQIFGTVVHAVCERFLKADELGYDKETGKPVELYPPGWHTAKERDGTVNEINITEQALVKTLIVSAIEEGVLARQPGGLVETKMSRQLLKDPPTVITGYIDYLHDGGVEDHKTTKAMKWAKSPAKLRENEQMLVYAHEWVSRRTERGGALPEHVDVVHNVFCKDPLKPKVRKTRARVPLNEVYGAWQNFQKIAQKMHALRSLEVWHQLPNPTNPRACQAFGGCPFAPICQGQESPEIYRSRVDSVKQFGVDYSFVASTKSNTKSMVSFKEKIKAAAAAKAAVANAQEEKPLIDPKEAQKPAQDVKPAAQPKSTKVEGWGDTPPWANPDCKVCKGRGFSIKTGKPCRACEAKCGFKVADSFELVSDDDGTVLWIGAVDGEEFEGSTLVVSEVKAEEKEPEPEPEPKPKPEPEKKAAPATASRGRGRPPASFKLLINCVVEGLRDSRCVRLTEVVQPYMDAMAEAQGADRGYYSLDAFKRRDGLRELPILDKIIEDLGTNFVLVHLDGPDTSSLVEALIPRAEFVVRGAR